MTEEFVIELGTQMIKTTIFLAGPMLGVAMVVGICVSIVQAITQINEATLTFIPKILGIALVLFVLSPWMLKIIQEYAIFIFGGFGDIVR